MDDLWQGTGSNLCHGDNLVLPRGRIRDDQDRPIHPRPTRNADTGFNVLLKAPSGAGSAARIKVLDDTPQWHCSTAQAFFDVARGGTAATAAMLRATHGFRGNTCRMTCVAKLAVCLTELRRAAKPTNSPHLHCDRKAGCCSGNI